MPSSAIRIGNGDKVRWLGFDLVVLFNDSFFVACMLLISGLFVHDSLTRRGQAGYGLAFALLSAVMTFTVVTVSRAFASSNMKLLDAMRPQAYGIFLTHYTFIIWLQYAVYDYSWPAFVKFAIVFGGTLALSWAVTALARRIPAVARVI